MFILLLLKETNKLSSDFDKVSNNYNYILNEFENNAKKLKEKEKLVSFLEKEIKRRTDEYETMVNIFFLHNLPNKKQKKNNNENTKINNKK